MFNLDQVQALAVAHIELLKKMLNFKISFEFDNNQVVGYVKTSKGTELMSVNIADYEDDAQDILNLYHQKVALLNMSKEVA